MTTACRLAHVGLAVADLEAAVTFFTDFLGFTLKARIAPVDKHAVAGITGLPDASVDEIAFVAHGDWTFELLHYVAPLPARMQGRPCDPGTFHWLVETDDFDVGIANARQHGFVGKGPPYAIAAGPNAGKRGTYLYHPDGLTLEVIG